MWDKQFSERKAPQTDLPTCLGQPKCADGQANKIQTCQSGQAKKFSATLRDVPGLMSCGGKNVHFFLFFAGVSAFIKKSKYIFFIQ